MSAWRAGGPASEPGPLDVHPERLRALIAHWISRLGLDLQDRIVVTEAGTNHFALTPVIAAQAGAARVFTLSGDSRWGRAADAHATVEALRRALGAPDRISPLNKFDEDVAGKADLVTNLGWVRPLDAARISRLRPRTVIAAMCEAWEVRKADIDLHACAKRGVRVAAVNEDHPLVDVFEYNGLLAVKMLQQLQIEIHGTRICVAGRGKFADRIAPFLENLGATVHRAHTLSGEDAAGLCRADALVVADYDRTDLILGEGGEMSAEELIKRSPHVAVVQFAGWIRTGELLSAGLRVFPEEEAGPLRMGRTMAYLGPAPLVGLHAAGMKAATMLQAEGVPEGPGGLAQEVLAGGPGAPGD